MATRWASQRNSNAAASGTTQQKKIQHTKWLEYNVFHRGTYTHHSELVHQERVLELSVRTDTHVFSEITHKQVYTHQLQYIRGRGGTYRSVSRVYWYAQKSPPRILPRTPKFAWIPSWAALSSISAIFTVTHTCRRWLRHRGWGEAALIAALLQDTGFWLLDDRGWQADRWGVGLHEYLRHALIAEELTFWCTRLTVGEKNIQTSKKIYTTRRTRQTKSVVSCCSNSSYTQQKQI